LGKKAPGTGRRVDCIAQGYAQKRLNDKRGQEMTDLGQLLAYTMKKRREKLCELDGRVKQKA
jgi:hypothetical protein